MQIVVGAFRNAEGAFTLENIANLFTPAILGSFWISIRISFASALLGCIIGFAVAWAVTLGGLPRWLRGPVMTFSGVASNFAGVPLAFAFLATLGRLGLVTVLLREWFGINLFALGFNLLSFWGLTLTYLFFQIPLMILIVTPALDGLKREWREAAEILGASPFQYWRMVALPILWPTLLGTLALLFANAFGAVATAYALTGSSLTIVPILLFAQIRGDVLGDPAPRLCARLRHDRHHRHRQRALHLDAHPRRAVDQMSRIWAWLALAVGMIYFFLPLIATFEFSLRMRRGVYSFDAYRVVLADPQFQATFGYSVVMALLTILMGVILVVPTAYWVRLKLPRWRPVIEFITLLPLVIPAIVIVFGYVRLYNTSSILPLTGTAMGTNLLLLFGYTTLALPYMYRAVDTGLRAIDVAHADRGGAEPRRGLDHHHGPGDPAERAGGGAVGRLPDLRHRHRRVHHGGAARTARPSAPTCSSSAPTAPTSRRRWR